MQKLKKLCLSLAAVLAISVPLSACVADNIDSSPLESSSISTSTSSGDSSSEESSAQTQEEMWAIVDALYALSPGESLPEESYTLTGIVTATEYVNKRRSFTMVVVGREDKPVYCFNISGKNASSVQKGDTITVSGVLKNYRGEYFEFDNGCILENWISANPDTNNNSGSSDSNNDNTTTEQPFTPATSNEEAKSRTANFQLSGSVTTPTQAPNIASNQPKSNGKLIRNSQMKFSENGKAYTVVDANGNDAFTVYRDGAYITLEEVAAFVYAFGTYPANYTTSKDLAPSDSDWGEYLRLNHTKFSGDTSKYPYEPVLPNISGCGGSLTYYEMDIGTTGTDCDPSYPIRIYNNGETITRGAARIVYGKKDLNNNGVYEENEFHLFYTYNHYNDFQEYLNYQGGWGEMFGNITGGGKLSSYKYYNPTDYVPVSLEVLPALLSLATTPISECSIL